MQTNPQAANTVVMIRPHQFRTNEQTLEDNAFQRKASSAQSQHSEVLAYQQVSTMVERLRQTGIEVLLFEDEGDTTPDSVFPNNWFSTHADSTLALYPMYPQNRRLERRLDIIEYLKSQYQIKSYFDFSALEQQQTYLEGTGAMVLDQVNKIAYVARSKRSHSQALAKFCDDLDYRAISFNAMDQAGVAVYHTNVMMCIGTHFALVGSQMIINEGERNRVLQSLHDAGKEVIELSEWQIQHFCANALELSSDNGALLALSQTAFYALSVSQKNTLEQYVKLLPLQVSALESAGGSVRCMLAAIHLSSSHPETGS
jgi:hypothetical protein